MEVLDAVSNRDICPLAIGVFGQKIHVSVNHGSDVSGDGTVSSPYASITNAIFKVVGVPLSPAAILVENGTYGAPVLMDANESLYGGYTDQTFSNRSSAQPATIIAGTGVSIVVEMANTTIIDGFSITNANTYGIRSAAITPTVIANCRITGNGKYDTLGAGVALLSSTPIVIHNDIFNNRASYYHGGTYGAGLLVSGAGAVIMRNRIFHNYLDAGGPGVEGYGCGVSIKGSPTISPYIGQNLIANNTLWANNLTAGAGIYCAATGVIIEANQLVGNMNVGIGYAGNRGGAICVSANTVSIRNNIIWGSEGYSSGGGVYANGSVTIINNTFGFNTAIGGGGGIYLLGSSSTIIANNILYDNKDFDIAEGAVLAPNLANNDFYGNTSGLYYDDNLTPLIYLADVNAMLTATNNIDVNPGIIPVATGQRLGAIHDEAIGMSTFTTAYSNYIPHAFAGCILRMVVAKNICFFIVDNDTNTFQVTGDVDFVPAWGFSGLTRISTNGDAFEVYDYHISSDSPCTNRGDNTYAGLCDIDSDTMSYDGNIDIGADEYTYDFVPIRPVISGMALYQDQCDLLFGSVGRRTYSLQCADFLTSGSWSVSLLQIVTGDGFVKTLTDTNAVNSKRFYRIKMQ